MGKAPGRFASALLEWSGIEDPSVEVRSAAVHIARALITLSMAPWVEWK